MVSEGYSVPGIDTNIPNVARIYDYLLGGKDNFAADRIAAEQLLDAVPEARAAAKANRAFLRRAVRFLTKECGIRQFIDIGTGLPTQGSVHEIAHEYAPDARVLYVDYDPIVTVHARALLADNATVMAVNGDLRQAGGILDHPVRRDLIDLTQPVAVLLVAVLHFIEDSEDPHFVAETFRKPMAAGSYLVISHVTGDDVPPEVTDAVRELYESASAPGVPRTRAEVARFFDGLDIIPPGVVNVSDWRPDGELSWPGRLIFYAGIGRKK